MVCDKILNRIGVSGVLMLAAGMATAFSTVVAYAGAYTLFALLLMIVGVACASMGYAFLYLVRHLKKTNSREKEAGSQHRCFSIG